MTTIFQPGSIVTVGLGLVEYRVGYMKADQEHVDLLPIAGRGKRRYGVPRSSLNLIANPPTREATIAELQKPASYAFEPGVEVVTPDGRGITTERREGPGDYEVLVMVIGGSFPKRYRLDELTLVA